MLNVVRREPILLSGAVEAVIVLLVSFGLELSAEQVGAILGVVAVLSSIIARAFVSPSGSDG